MKLYNYTFTSPLRGYADLRALQFDEEFYCFNTCEMAKLIQEDYNVVCFLAQHVADLLDCMPEFWEDQFKEAIVQVTFGNFDIKDDCAYFNTTVCTTRQLTAEELTAMQGWIAWQMEDGWGQEIKLDPCVDMYVDRVYNYFNEETLNVEQDCEIVSVQYYISAYTKDNWNVELAGITPQYA